MSLCPCGSFLPRNCCEPLVRGTAEATTALALMFTVHGFYGGKVDYLFQTYAGMAENNPFERLKMSFNRSIGRN